MEVQIGSINDIDSQHFFDTMTSKISENINHPNYTTVMDCAFSTSTPVHKIVNNIMLMYSFKNIAIRASNGLRNSELTQEFPSFLGFKSRILAEIQSLFIKCLVKKDLSPFKRYTL